MLSLSIDALDAVDRDVLAVSTAYPPDTLLEWHDHRRAQFLYGATGVMLVETDDGSWTVPTNRAVMIPPSTRHRVRMLGVTTQSLYIEASAVVWWPLTCIVVDVAPLLSELLDAATALDVEYDTAGRDGVLVALVLHELARLSPLPLSVHLPAVGVLRDLCQDYLDAPDAGVTNAQWARRAALSERGLTRAFRTETGIGPAEWRRHARLLAAIPRLAQHSVTRVAGDLGYSSPAAFTAAFTHALGRPPRNFVPRRRVDA